MPVRKLRSLEEAEEAVWMDRDDPRLLDTIRAVWALSARLAPRRFPPGVYKHRSIEELNRQTERWEAEAIARARERRSREAARDDSAES